MDSLNDVFKLLKDSYFNPEFVASSYGMFYKEISVPNPTGESDVYWVFSIKPISDKVNPVEIINKVSRNQHLFYPEAFAVNAKEGDPVVNWSEITSYLKFAEFLVDLYKNFDTPLPEYIRYNEINDLIDFCSNQNNVDFTEDSRKQYSAGVKAFFELENTGSKIKKEWRDFYRSELYSDEQSLAKNMVKFLKRDEPEVEIDALLESNDTFKEIRIPEHYYKKFQQIIKEQYPDVKYYAGNLRICDKGIIVDPKTGERPVTQYGKTVTDKEYDRILERDFAQKGHDSVRGLSISYIENRDILYKASDENIVASIINNLMLKWAKCPSIEELQRKGKLKKIDIPIKYLKNFYILMKDNNIPITIDNDVNRKPNFKMAHVLYNAENEEKMNTLVIGLAIANISMSHVSLEGSTYDIDINQYRNIINNAKQRYNAAN